MARAHGLWLHIVIDSNQTTLTKPCSCRVRLIFGSILRVPYSAFNIRTYMLCIWGRVCNIVTFSATLKCKLLVSHLRLTHTMGNWDRLLCLWTSCAMSLRTFRHSSVSPYMFFLTAFPANSEVHFRHSTCRNWARLASHSFHYTIGWSSWPDMNQTCMRA